MNPEITLIYDADCPNASAARAALCEALAYVGLEPLWIEYERSAPGIPAEFRRFGSPTILVEGKDVADERAVATAASCRVYEAACGLSGIPPIEAIVAAIKRRGQTAHGKQEVL